MSMLWIDVASCESSDGTIASASSSEAAAVWLSASRRAMLATHASGASGFRH